MSRGRLEHGWRASVNALRGVAFAACVLLGACAAPPPSGASDGVSRREAALSAGAGAFEADLDQRLTGHDYADLSQRIDGALSGSDDALRLRTVNWLALKQSHGDTDSAYVAQLYTVGLVQMAAHSQEPARVEWIKDAVVAYDRTFIIALSEAGQCRDAIAVDARLGQVARTLGPIKLLLPQLSQTDRDSAARKAFLLASLTFPTRYPDDWLCRPRGDGPAVFQTYDAWGPGYGKALQAAAKGFLPGEAPPPTLAPVLLRKRPDIVPMYK